MRTTHGLSHRDSFHALNLISDQLGHVWIIDGQNERVYDLDNHHDVRELNERYRPDYISRAVTGVFRPRQL